MATTVFFSEYVEGSSNNKAIEIANFTGSAVDLTPYTLEFYFNGSNSAGTTIDLTGTVADNDVFVVADNDAVSEILAEADQISTSSFFNGDDAVVLRNNGDIVDVIGQIGFDPGSEWSGGGIGTQNQTLRRQSNVTAGDTNGTDAFDPSVEWEGFPQDTFDDLGSHTVDHGNGGSTTADIVINEVDADTPGSDTAEFVELYDGGVGNTALDGLTVVFFNGSDDASYEAFDLDGFSTNAEGFFVLGNPGVANVDLTFDPGGSGALQNGADAVALYQADAADFPNDTPVTTENLLDAIVYDTSDPDDSGLLTGLGQDTQFNEDANGNGDSESNSRVPDGTGSFVAQTPTPGTPNAVDPPVEVTPIYQIQGAAQTSPLEGESVTTEGIVTAVDTNGFYLQDVTGDGDVATSDGIFVFTSSSPSVSVGEAVEVSGTVSEFIPGGAGTGNLSITQISGSPTITTLSQSNPLPTPVILGVDRIPPTQIIDDDLNSLYNVLQGGGTYEPTEDGIDFYESLEGMRVTINQPLAVAGTTRFGEIFTVVNNGANATSISDRGTINIDPNDFNPERVQIDSDSFTPGGIPDVDTGAELDNVTGVVSYSFGNFEVLATEAVTVSDQSSLTPEVSNIAPAEDQLTVASYNVLNLDPNDGDGDTDIADGRFEAIANDIVNNLNTPDIIGLQEIQDNDGSTNSSITAADETLGLLIDEIAAISGVTYELIDNPFIGDDTSGGQPGGNIRTAFLYNPNRVSLSGDPLPDQPFQGSVQTVVDPQDQQNNPDNPFFNTRLPLVGFFSFNGQEVVVVNNHFSSKGGSSPLFGALQPAVDFQEDPTINGDVGDRREQAQAVKAYVEGLSQENVAVVGDFNEFEFISPLDILEETLINLTETLPEDERYSFIFEGNSQALDHALVSDSLLDGAVYDIVHINAEFAATDTRASDHDPLLVGLSLAGEPSITNQTTIDGTPINDLEQDNTLGELIQSFGSGGPNGFVNIGSKLNNDSDFENFLFNDQVDASFQTTNGVQGIDGIRIKAIPDNSNLGELLDTDDDATTTSYAISVQDDESLVSSRIAGWDVGDFADAFANPLEFDDGTDAVNSDGTTLAVFTDLVGLVGTQFNDNFDGGEGNDFFNGGNGEDVVLGNDGSDRLLGGNNNDNLVGGDGRDQIRGGSGDDLLRGGGKFGSFGPEAGDNARDTFVFEAVGNGDDRLTDFELPDNGFHGDLLAFRIDNAGLVELGDELDNNGNLIITISNFVGQTGSLRLDGIDTSDEFNAIAGQIRVWGDQSNFSTNFDIVGMS